MVTSRRQIEIPSSPPTGAEPGDVPPWLLPFTAYEAFALTLSLAHPRPGLELAAGVGRLANQLSCYGPSPDDLGALLPELPPRRRAEIAREISAGAFKNRALRRLAQLGGLERLAPLVRWHGVERLQSLREQRIPAVILTWHMGPMLAIAAGFARLKLPALSIRAIPAYRPTSTIEVCLTRNRPELGRQAFERGIARLQSGGMVIVAADGGAVSTRPAAVLGRQTLFASGVAKFASMTGAAVIPVLARWASPADRIDVVVDDPLPCPPWSPRVGRTFEDAVVAESGKRWESHIRSTPEQLHPATVQRLLGAPKLAAPQTA